MLTNDEMMIALINNLGSDTYFTVKPTYPIDKEYADVIIRALKVYRKIKYDAVLEKMCDRNCKHKASVMQLGMDELEKHCEECPLKNLFN